MKLVSIGRQTAKKNIEAENLSEFILEPSTVVVYNYINRTSVCIERKLDMPFFNNTPKPTFKLNLDKNKYVPVIASYDTNGNCKPLYFRYNHLDGTSEKISIDRVEKVMPNSLFGLNYYCVVTINEIQMTVVLFHSNDDYRWALRLY